MKAFLRLAVILGFHAAIVPVSQASSPKIITYSSQTDFEKGDPKGVSINFFGEVVLAPQIEEILQPELAFVWATASDRKGYIYAGGGTGGKVFQIGPDHNSKIIFEAPEIQIYSLVVDRSDNLYIASSPHGKVYKIPFGQNKTTTNSVFFDPSETYIWSMAFDAQRNLYVATGEKGNIYKVAPDGKEELFYASEDVHIRKIIFDSAGNLIAGTANEGIILKITPSAEAFVLYDSPLAEITDLMIDSQGQIFAVANGETRTLNQPSVPSAEDSGNSDDEDDGDEPQTSDLGAQQIVVVGGTPQPNQNSILYKIDTDGTVTTIWKTVREQIYALAPGPSAGELILGTGSKGRLYSITDAGEYKLLTELDEIDITTLGRKSNGELYFGTSNAGKVYHMQKKLSRSGEFISDVIDASVISQWGALSWEAVKPAGTRIEFFTRSGNTEKPDKTWSNWSGAYTSDTSENMTNPAARFLQVKAVLHSDDGSNSPVLRAFSVSYLQKNISPRVKIITFHSPGEYYAEAANHSVSNSHLDDDDNNGQSPSYGRKSFRQGYRTVSWYAEDQNSDVLRYNVYYRGEDESNWKTLAEELRGTVYSWDSELLPDGRFVIKVEASDASSNPPAQSLTSEKISQPFIVDNSGPQVSGITVQSHGSETTISFFVEDEWNIIDSVEYGLNANDWTLVYPEDGIADSKKEKFVLNLNSSVTGSNTIVIKAKDVIKNIGFGKTNFMVKK